MSEGVDGEMLSREASTSPTDTPGRDIDGASPDAGRARAGFGKGWYEPLCFRPEWETRDVELDAAKFFAEAEAKEAEKRAEEARKQKQADDIEDTNRRIFLL